MTKPRSIAASITCLVFSSLSFAAQQAPTPWPLEIKTQHRPGTYWWCPGSAFDKDSIDWNLEGLHKARVGTVHIVPIYGAKGYEDRYIQYLSPKWMEMLDHIVKKAQTLGMNVDMTTGTGWCFGGPGLAKSTADVVVSYDTKTKKLSFAAKRMVKRAAPGGEGHMLNPYSPAAMRFYLERFSKAFDQTRPAMPRAQYHDSFEYACDWCPELLAEFKARRGYDLADHLDLFFAKSGDPERRARLKCDYRITLGDLHREAIEVWADWARARGMLTRNQAHGSPANLLDVYAAADIPETEMFGAPNYPIPGFRRDPAMVRPGDSDRRVCMFASSAAHVAHPPGKQLVSSESCTWLREHWHGSLAQVKLELDQFFLAGINHVFYHGCCYSPKDAPWPGWFFYASTKFDSRNSIWRDFPVLNTYVARCQSVLQTGVPFNDVLLYWPIHDYWTQPEGTKLQHIVHSRKWLDSQPFGRVAQDLIDKGYAFDFISDRLLQGIDAKNGALHATGGIYRAVVVPACRYVPVTTLLKLADLADKGATVIFHKSIPSDVPGLGRLDQRRKELATERTRLTKVNAIVAPDVLAALEAADVPRESLTDAGLQCIRRKTSDGFYYFIANQTAKAWDGWLPLAVACKSATLLDPMTGRSGAIATRQDGGRCQAYLQLAPGESRIIQARHELAAGPPWTYLQPKGQPVPITGQWQVDFIEGGPDLPAAYKLDKLASWTNAPDDHAKRFAGTARYKITFNLPPGDKPDEWLLDLGDVRESARVRINGQDAGALIALPFRLSAGRYVKPGPNTLEVEVTNLTANRIRDLDRRKVDWKIMKDINIVTVDYKPLDATNWPLTDSGLLGPVQLIPMSKKKIEGD
ncbi:MAG: glycoside hydrolase family 2 [Phycisphaerae bacterium]|nr:glycoside hydrolase family 2 [Phycisphaerae bacterium]